MEHQFCVELASKYGIEEAIIIQNLYFWIKKNVANECNFYDGRYWTYNSSKAFSVLFPYMNESKIYRVLKSLEQQEFIVKGNYNETKYIRTTWYSFSDKAISELNALKYDVKGFVKSNLQNDDFHFTKMQNGTCESEETITDNNTYSNTNNKEDTNVSKKENLDYDFIKKEWDRINPNLASIRGFNDKRKTSIKNLLKKNNASVDDLIKAFQIVSISSFCNGSNDRKWKASFDWLINDTKSCFNRLLEGGFTKNRYEKEQYEAIMSDNKLSLHTSTNDSKMKFQF